MERPAGAMVPRSSALPQRCLSARVIGQVIAKQLDCFNSMSSWQDSLFIGDPLKSFNVSVSAGFSKEEWKRAGSLRLLRARPAVKLPHHYCAGQVFALSSQLKTRLYKVARDSNPDMNEMGRCWGGHPTAAILGPPARRSGGRAGPGAAATPVPTLAAQRPAAAAAAAAAAPS
jgi:hypothetical protein